MSEVKEVYFNQYCHLCEHKDVPENQEPCDECIEIAGRAFSHKPEHFSPKDGSDSGVKEANHDNRGHDS